jgi:hypothetical protein
MFLNTWISEARQHWRQFRPTLFRELERTGKLNQALWDAAERTHREMSELENSGFRHHEAWEMVRERYLFPPQEKPPKDDGNTASRMLTEMIADKSRLLRQLAGTESDE